MFHYLHRSIALLLLCSSFSLFAQENLLSLKQWKFLQVNGAVGSMNAKADGPVEIRKENDAGVLFFHCGGNEVEIIPGKSYELTAQFQGSGESLQAYFMLSFPGPQPRTPFPVSESQKITGEAQTLKYQFAALEGETRLRIHFCIKGQGELLLSGLSMQEYLPAANLLERPETRLVLRQNLGGVGTLQKSGSIDYEVSMSNDSGYVAVVPDKDLAIMPGRHYRVRMSLTRLTESGSAKLMLSMPGGKRTPFPSVQARKQSGQQETLEYIFTAEKDEKLLRPHLVVYGPARVLLHALELQELTESEFEKSQQQGRLMQMNFTAEKLHAHWDPHGAREILPTKDCMEILSTQNGGFQCQNLSWTAADVKAIQVRFRVYDEGGYLRLDFDAEDEGKKYTSYFGVSSIPDGEWHDLIFPIAEDPAWRGKITNIKLSWRAPGAKIALQRVCAIPEANLIPFADSLQAGKDYELEFIRPRGKYRLSWKGAHNPGVEVFFFDRDRKLLLQEKLVGLAAKEIQAPERTVSAAVRLLAASGQGYPLLTLEEIPRLDIPPAYWRGSWIWNQNGFGPTNTNVWFQREIELEQIPEEATLLATGDDILEVFINGKSIGQNSNWADARRFALDGHLKPGKNSLVLRVYNVQAWGGMLCDLYLKTEDKIQYIVSDASWRCHVGGDQMPETFTQAVMVLGPVPAPPWGTRVIYRYIGPIGQIRILQAGEQLFTAKVLHAPAVDSKKLQFCIRTSDGQEKRVHGTIEPSTGTWAVGQDITVRYQLPTQYESEGIILLDTEYLQVENNQPVGQLARKAKPKTDFPTVRIEGAGERAWIVANGKKLSPFYYDLPATFSSDPESRAHLVRNAVRSGVDVIRFKADFDDFWLGDGRYDFSKLEHCQEMLSANAPNLFQIIIVRTGMPKWWLKQNPDDETRYYGDKPIHQQKDRQALASKKYLQDASVALRTVLGFLRNSPYADRVIAIGLSEGWNSEWFWSYEDGMNRPARSGFSKADYATFRSYLREKYGSDEKLAQAWNEPGLTFETITMPTPEEQDAGSLLTMLQPEKDMRLMDWFAFRNRALAEAITSLGKVVKEETQGKLLTCAYYGYLIAFSNIFNRLQTVGHLGIEETARSPYLDWVWAPSYYTWRYSGMNDSPMQAAESYTSHGKMVIVEQDMRTFGETSNYEIRNGQLSTVAQSVGAMNRAFGMAVSRGLGTHWMEMYERWFREEVLLELIRKQIDCYRSLPPVQGLTPVEVCIVSDQKSAFYVKHNAGDGSHRALIGELVRRGNEMAVPFRHVLLADLLEENRIPSHKFYIITNLFALTDNERAQLLQRFEREKATVLWQYAPGAFYPDRGPSAEFISKLLGIKVAMEERLSSPQIKFSEGWPVQTYRNPVHSGPWFWPESGFSNVLAHNDAGAPALVSWENHGVRHYFSSLMHLPIPVLRQLAATSGVHIYNAEAGDPLHIGNDVVFLHAKTSGAKTILLPEGMQLRAIAGPIQGVLQSGQSWQAQSGQTYGFLVEKR